jgi:hypothetical protein
MDFPQIIEQFAADGPLPKAAILAAVTEPQAFVPKAIEILERQAAGMPISETDKGAIMLIVHALGEIGDSSAFGPLVDLLAVSRDELDILFGDSIGETVPGILMRLGGGNIARIEEAFLKPDIDEFARDAMFMAWTYFVLEGRIERDAARSFLTDFPDRAKEAGLGKNDYGWVGWTHAVASLKFRGLAPMVEAIFAEGYMGPDKWGMSSIDIEDFRAMLDEAENAVDCDAWMAKERYVPFTDTIGTLSTWYGYSEKYLKDRQRWAEKADFEESLRTLATASNPNRSVGRNDPCPCGSGKKYKKCCLQ